MVNTRRPTLFRRRRHPVSVPDAVPPSPSVTVPGCSAPRRTRASSCAAPGEAISPPDNGIRLAHGDHRSAGRRTDASTAAAARRDAGGALLLATFAAAIFVSAALLFMVQPMFTKMVLPRFGGAPSVWSVAIVFFQAALLAGYAYAHLLTRYAPGRRFGRHPSRGDGGRLLYAAALDRRAAGAGRRRSARHSGCIGLFAASIGLPFFALAANGPLLQAWFARTDHPAARDPYFLYAASNVGSFLALVSYPVAIEPFVRLGEQARFWSIGFYLLIVLIAACGALLWRSPDRAPAAGSDGAQDAAPPSWRDAAFWVALAAVPSGLLVAVTAHISTDVAAVPLLWVLPLALYLLTFVIVFQRRPIIPHWLAVERAAAVHRRLMAVIAVRLEPVKTIVGLVAVHVAVFFVCALVCHGELARRRPPARYLTAFYLWMSAGGMIGGIAAGLIAPHVFNWVAEYPILIALAVLCRPGLACRDDRAGAIALFAALAAAWRAAGRCASPSGHARRDHLQLDRRRPAGRPACCSGACRCAFAAIVAFVLLANHSIVEQSGAMLVRSFFGVAKVSETDRRPVPPAAARHHAARRPAYPRGRWTAGDRSAPSCCSTTGTAPPSPRPSTRCARASAGRSATP